MESEGPSTTSGPQAARAEYQGRRPLEHSLPCHVHNPPGAQESFAVYRSFTWVGRAESEKVGEIRPYRFSRVCS
jgi:hypothetical protein